MKTNTAMESPTRAAPARFPVRRLAAVGIGGMWVALAAAESVMSQGQDALDDVRMISENYTQIATAGLLHWLGAMLLVVGLVGLAPLIWCGRTARAGWFLCLPLAVGLGSFAMVHLLALETAAAGLDGAAMNQFLVQRLGDGAGPWIIPMAFVALLGPWSFVLLLVGMVHLHLTHWAAPAVFAAGALMHMVFAAEILETMSLWIMAAGALLAAVGVLRTQVQPAASGSGALDQQ